jgi:hypothetical protein
MKFASVDLNGIDKESEDNLFFNGVLLQSEVIGDNSHIT